MIKKVFTYQVKDEPLHTPIFTFDGNVVTITGRALPEYAAMVWVPFIEELKQYIIINKNIVLNFKLEYFNSASSRYVSDLFVTLAELRSKCSVTINWYYLDIDEDMEYYGDLYKSANPLLNFNLIKTKDL